MGSWPPVDPRDAALAREIIDSVTDDSDAPDSADLARLHVEAHHRDAFGMSLRTGRGRLRLAGAGVVGHGARFDHTGNLMTNWQRTVSAAGASLEGVTGVRGRLRQDIRDRTQMMLVASPGEGSVILEFEPESSEVLEKLDMYGGNLPLQGEDLTPGSPLIDRSVGEVIDLLASADDTDIDHEQFKAKLATLGPRVAGSVKALSRAMVESGVDIEVTWESEGSIRRRTSFTVAIAGVVAAIIDGSELEVESATVRGRIVTVGRTKPLEIEDADGLRYSVRHEDVDTAGFAQEETVEVGLTIRPTVRPDGSEKYTYNLVTIERVESDA